MATVKFLFLILNAVFIYGMAGCRQTPPDTVSSANQALEPSSGPLLVVLGIAQDAGFPQAECLEDCCALAWDNPELRRMVSSLAVVHPEAGKHWLFDATPDIKDQLHLIRKRWDTELSGIFITHAHIGHYTGLMHLGKEVMHTNKVPVYTLPKMSQFLAENGPWSQLVKLQNIELKVMADDSTIKLMPDLEITALKVPHRDEYGETAGFKIKGVEKSALFIPDIDSWDRWDRDITKQISQVDLAFIDGSFYRDGELGHRDMSSIPHPRVLESMDRFEKLAVEERSKVHFIHFNHTNPLLNVQSDAYQEVLRRGFRVAEQGKEHEI